MIVNLANGSRWTVTGTSYLSALTVSSDSAVSGAGGRTVTMTVNGAATPIVPGHTYTGEIRLTVS